MQLFTGKQYLMIDIANNFGGNGVVELDKMDWDARLDWYKNNEHQLDKLVKDAAEPALFYAGIQAMKKVNAGQAIGYPISLDATSSGLQILAALTCDEKAAKLCNVVDAGTRMDAYITLFHTMKKNMERIDAGEAGKLKRSDLKQAIMTSLYGSEKVPKLVFGEGQQLRCFFGTMKEEAPIAWELNEAFLAIWNPEATEYNWVLPDNFHVKTKVMDTETETVHFNNNKYEIHTKVNRAKEKGRSLGANTIHSLDGMIVREISRRCDYNPDQISTVLNALECIDPTDHSNAPERVMCQILWDNYLNSGYLSARILDYVTHRSVDIIDRNSIRELIESMPKKPFKVLSVHDCFRVLPHYGNDLRKQYNLQLSLIAKSDLLTNLLRQITGNTKFVAPKGKPDMWKDILHTNYSLS